VAKLESQTADLKEIVSKRDIEIEIMKRQLREAQNMRMEIGLENQRLKNEIEKA